MTPYVRRYNERALDDHRLQEQGYSQASGDLRFSRTCTYSCADLSEPLSCKLVCPGLPCLQAETSQVKLVHKSYIGVSSVGATRVHQTGHICSLRLMIGIV